MLIMENWNRSTGTRWVRHLGQLRAQVDLGTGGWFWSIIRSDGVVIATGDQATSRSRKARRQAQHKLLALAAVQAVAPVTKIRLTKAAAL